MEKNKNMAQTESYLRELLDHMINAVVVYEALDNGHDFVFKDANTATQKMEGRGSLNMSTRHLKKSRDILLMKYWAKIREF